MVGSTPSMTITPTTSKNTLTTDRNVSEKGIVAAMMLKAALARLEKDGLIKRYRVLSPDRTTVKKILIEFSCENWTQDLELTVVEKTVVS